MQLGYGARYEDKLNPTPAEMKMYRQAVSSFAVLAGRSRLRLLLEYSSSQVL